MDKKENFFIKWNRLNFKESLSDLDANFIRKVFPEKWNKKKWEHFKISPSKDLAVFHHPALLKNLLETTEHLYISMELYCYILLYHALSLKQLANEPLLDYLVSILLYGLTSKNAFNNSIHQGKTFFYLGDSLRKVDTAGYEHQFYMRVKLANQVLYLTGIFKEHIRYRTLRKGAPDLKFLERMGQFQYNKAKTHELALEYNLQEVLSQLSYSFTDVRKALNHFSENYMSLGDFFI